MTISIIISVVLILWFSMVFLPYQQALCSTQDSTYYLYPQGCLKDNPDNCELAYGEGWKYIGVNSREEQKPVCSNGKEQKKLIQ